MSRNERGSATVLVAVFCAVLLVVTLLGVALAGLVTARRRVASAADLAALAGAGAVQQGRPACGPAGIVAVANGARLVACTTIGEVVSVLVVADYAAAFGWTLHPTARARAGPDRGVVP